MIVLQYTANMIIQYSVVGLALLAACIWIIWKLYRKNKKGASDTCCNCALAEKCEKNKLEKSKPLNKCR